MISFQIDGIRFNYRVVGVCIEAGNVLLHKAERDDFWSLPGGRCEILESSDVSLEREMQEELHVEVGVGQLLWMVENFFKYNGAPFHELALYYAVTLPDENAYSDRQRTYKGVEDDLALLFRWFPVDSLADIRLFPSFLKEGLRNPPLHPQHVVHTDIDERF